MTRTSLHARGPPSNRAARSPNRRGVAMKVPRAASDGLNPGDLAHRARSTLRLTSRSIPRITRKSLARMDHERSERHSTPPEKGDGCAFAIRTSVPRKRPTRGIVEAHERARKEDRARFLSSSRTAPASPRTASCMVFPPADMARGPCPKGHDPPPLVTPGRGGPAHAPITGSTGSAYSCPPRSTTKHRTYSSPPSRRS